MEAIKALLKQITAFWEGKDKRFKRNAIIIASVVLAAIVITTVLLNQVPYSELYKELSAEDASAVTAKLEEQKVNYRVSGNTILVPSSQADSLRLSLSAEIKQSFNLDILKQGQGLGMTDDDKNDYRKYQIQDDIRRAIKTLKGVKDAVAAITMPTESVYVLDSSKRDATAGVILTLENGMELSQAQIKAIYLFVQKNVPGLKLDNISIMDSEMRNLDYNGSDDPGVSANTRYDLQYDVQSKLRKQIMALLQPVFGIGSVEAQVNVALDFDTKIEDAVKFEPVVDGKSGIVESIEKLREQIVNGSSASGQPGTDTNTGTGTTTYPVVNVDNGTYEKNAETINYEINSIKTHLEKEKGSIKNLSVSVVIDNTNTKDDYSDTVKDLVANAVGVSRELITVAYMPMTGTQSLKDAIAKGNEAAVQQQQTSLYLPLAIVGGFVLLSLIAMLLVFGTKRAKERAVIDQQTAILTAEAAASEEMQQMEEELAAIKIVKESGTKEQIGRLIENNPELVANLLRSWLAEDQE